MKAIAVLFLLIAAVSAAPFWVDITNGTNVHLYIPATIDVETTERLQTVYRIFVPENTLQVDVASGPIDGCFDPEVMVSTRAPTCGISSGDYPSSSIVPCSNYWESTSNRTINGWEYQSSFDDLAFGTYWYIGIRKDTFDSDTNCTYSTAVTITPCPSGSISIGETTPVCVAVNAINATTNYKLNNVTSNDAALVYVVDFPVAQTYITAIIYSDDTSLTAAGWTEVGNLESYIGFCYNSHDSTLGGVNLTCYGVRPGRFFISVTTSSSTSGSGNFSIIGATCPAGKSGPFCTDSLKPFFANITGGLIAANDGSNGGHYNQDIYYLDFNVNDTFAINITVSAVNGSGHLIYRKDVFPYYESVFDFQGGVGHFSFDSPQFFDNAGSGPVGLYLTPKDTYVGGRHYFSVANFNSAPLNYTFSYQTVSTTGVVTTGATTGATTAVTTGATTTGATTTGATTTGATTTGATTAKPTTGSAATTTSGKATTGSASTIVVPLVMMVAAILALVF